MFRRLCLRGRVCRVPLYRVLLLSVLFLVLAVGQSPKTEYIWYDAQANDATGKRIAEMRMMIRYVKASSVLYDEDATTHV